MRVAICDDLAEERWKLKEALAGMIQMAVIDEFEDGRELLVQHQAQPYQLIFLDMLMPKISGLDTAAALREADTKTPIVFVSTSEEFGVQSYRVLAFDYLLKPIEMEQLQACIKRFLSQQTREDFIMVSYLGTEIKLRLSNIQCLESNLRKVVFTLAENQEIEISGKLTDFEEYLVAHGFCRCHKSYLVNLEQIAKMEEGIFYLTGKKQVKISRTYLQSAKKAYLNYMFSKEM